MGLSDKCPDLKTRWDRLLMECVPCRRKPGHEVTPNCGYDDKGGRHVPPTTSCKPDTFNDGSSAYCKPCALCPLGFIISSPCNSTIDTKCEETRHPGTEVPVNNQTSQGSTSSPNATSHQVPSFHSALWTAPLAILVTVVVFSAYIFYMKRKKGQNTVMNYSRRSSYIKAGFTPLSAEAVNNDLKDVLSPNVLSAPLQTVLDNLDVLEDLMILLDPESHGVKNTKHLASHCSFTSTWITYTYSMKDSKSPLKAVLEGVTSRHPDWTVGHLAKLLRQMDRNDAIAVLAKVRLSEMDV
ncbi:IGF-like family receptor 1 isoform X1 [Labrus mixtus]|uniref:IGF-like family receptor 1 isoform X1 n=1 Tax=Labrus mixtus TaxID=508554 RepID=UPI0029C02821|nr:IGF-like family receptor 1 isoform X1 [Labrus mixtus]